MAVQVANISVEFVLSLELVPPLFDDEIVPLELDHLAFDYFLLNRVFTDEAVNVHRVFLPDSMGPVHRLEVHLRVPV